MQKIYNSDETKLYRCSAGDEHFVEIGQWDGDTYILIEDFWRAESFWKRVRRAWSVLWDGWDWLSEVILDKDEALDLALFMIAMVNKNTVVHNSVQDADDVLLMGLK